MCWMGVGLFVYSCLLSALLEAFRSVGRVARQPRHIRPFREVPTPVQVAFHPSSYRATVELSHKAESCPIDQPVQILLNLTPPRRIEQQRYVPTRHSLFFPSF
jgi:hypothetical protein